MSTILETRGLTHVYGAGTPFERVALDHVDLKIEKGEILAVSGLFVALGRLPDTQALVGLAALDENGYVFTDEKTAVPETPGLFVAGDCRIKSVYQLTTAVSDGTVAAISACEYLKKQK